MIVQMSKYGRSLVTRMAGRAAYEEVSQIIAGSRTRVVFDFDGVDSITNSFADEVFGHLVADMGIEDLRARTSFSGIGPFWARVVRNVMDVRESDRANLVTC